MVNSRRNKCIAFTLIELLVVIAIISLLVSILLPSLQKAREIAAQVTCASQLRNVGVAMHLYAEDHEIFPPCYVPGGQEGTTYENAFWTQKLLPYANESPRTMVCPNYLKSSAPQDSKWNYYKWFSHGCLAPQYGYHHRVLGCGGWAPGMGCVGSGGSKKVEVGPEHLVNPSRLGMCYDNHWVYGNPPELFGNIENARITYFLEIVDVLHMGGVNLLFCDDHVEWTDFDDEEYWFDDDQHWVNE